MPETAPQPAPMTPQELERHTDPQMFVGKANELEHLGQVNHTPLTSTGEVSNSYHAEGVSGSVAHDKIWNAEQNPQKMWGMNAEQQAHMDKKWLEQNGGKRETGNPEVPVSPKQENPTEKTTKTEESPQDTPAADHDVPKRPPTRADLLGERDASPDRLDYPDAIETTASEGASSPESDTPAEEPAPEGNDGLKIDAETMQKIVDHPDFLSEEKILELPTEELKLLFDNLTGVKNNLMTDATNQELVSRLSHKLSDVKKELDGRAAASAAVAGKPLEATPPPEPTAEAGEENNEMPTFTTASGEVLKTESDFVKHLNVLAENGDVDGLHSLRQTWKQHYLSDFESFLRENYSEESDEGIEEKLIESERIFDQVSDDMLHELFPQLTPEQQVPGEVLPLQGPGEPLFKRTREAWARFRAGGLAGLRNSKDADGAYDWATEPDGEWGRGVKDPIGPMTPEMNDKHSFKALRSETNPHRFVTEAEQELDKRKRFAAFATLTAGVAALSLMFGGGGDGREKADSTPVPTTADADPTTTSTTTPPESTAPSTTEADDAGIEEPSTTEATDDTDATVDNPWAETDGGNNPFADSSKAAEGTDDGEATRLEDSGQSTAEASDSR